MWMKTALRLFLCGALIATALGSCVFTLPQQVQVPAKSPVTIPADVTGYGLIFLRARVNNSQPMWFALDSGASFPLVIDDRRARDLGLKLQDNSTRESAGAGPDTYRVALTRDVSINLGDLKFTGQTAAVLAIGSCEALFGLHLDTVVRGLVFCPQSDT